MYLVRLSSDEGKGKKAKLSRWRKGSRCRATASRRRLLVVSTLEGATLCGRAVGLWMRLELTCEVSRPSAATATATTRLDRDRTGMAISEQRTIQNERKRRASQRPAVKRWKQMVDGTIQIIPWPSSNVGRKEAPRDWDRRPGQDWLTSKGHGGAVENRTRICAISHLKRACRLYLYLGPSQLA